MSFITEFQMSDSLRFEVMKLIRQFKFTVGILTEPEIAKNDDPRFDLMHALARRLEGCFFTPGAMLDESFRAFAAADGSTTPGAVIPNTADENFSDYEDDDDEPNPPQPERVARRMYVMLALAARGLLDMNLNAGRTPAYSLEELHSWFESLDIPDELESHERTILYTTEKNLSEQDCLNSVWALEALVVLAWALEQFELPPYDQLVETDDLLQALSFLDVPLSKQKLATAKLRAKADLFRYQEEIFAFDWRMVDYRVNSKVVDFEQIEIGGKPFDLSWAKLIDGDLSLQGDRIDIADENLVGAVCSLAMERHKASNWLSGYATQYSNISPDT